MLPPHELLFAIIDAAVAWASFLYQFVYFRKHKNGKKSLRLLCSFIMLYFAVVFTLMAVSWPAPESFGADYLRPFMWLLFFAPMWDARIDWNKGA